MAQDEAELRERVSTLLELETRSRGRVVLRELVRLRHTRQHGDFPLGREFRTFLLDGRIVARGYYWPHADPLSSLSDEEARTVDALTTRVAQKIPARFVALDCGQLESGEWTIIESGDPQFSGLSQINPLRYWNRLREVLTSRHFIEA